MYCVLEEESEGDDGRGKEETEGFVVRSLGWCGAAVSFAAKSGVLLVELVARAHEVAEAAVP